MEETHYCIATGITRAVVSKTECKVNVSARVALDETVASKVVGIGGRVCGEPVIQTVLEVVETIAGSCDIHVGTILCQPKERAGVTDPIVQTVGVGIRRPQNGVSVRHLCTEGVADDDNSLNGTMLASVRMRV